MLDPTLPDFFAMIYGRPGKKQTPFTHRTQKEQDMDHPQDADYFGFRDTKPAFNTGATTIEETESEPIDEDITTTQPEETGTP